MSGVRDLRYFLHLLCGFLCTFGLATYFTDVFGIFSASRMFMTLLLCLGFWVIPSLLHQQWLRFPLLSATFLFLSAMMVLFDGVMQKFYVATADFILWMIPFLSQGGHTDSRYIFALLMLVLTVIGLYCYISVSVIHSPFPVLLLTAASLIITPFLLPDADPNLLWLMPCVIGIALAMSLTSKAEKEQEKISLYPERSFLISVTAVLVSLLFIFFTAGIVVSDVPAKGFQNFSVVSGLNKLTRKGITIFSGEKKEPPPASLYDASSFGMRSEDMTLGGSVSLSDEMVFEVTADRDLLLKGRTYDAYESSSWGSRNSEIVMRFELPDSTFFLLRNSPEPVQIYGTGNAASNPYPNSVLLSLFDSFRPAPALIPPEYGSILFEQCDVTVKNASSLIGSSLFYPDHLVDATFTDPLFFDEDGALFSKKPLPIGSVYQVRSNVFRTFDPAYMETLLALEEYIISSPETFDDSTHKSNISADYLEANVPDHVIGEAIRVTDGYTTPLSKAFAIRDYLRDNFTYSLEVPDIPAGRDFVDYFLETKTGYCTYFASAMCMMARANGIPARFVEGFYVNVPQSESSAPSTVIVTGNSAHAWCEIYIDGIGWIPFDATPGFSGDITPEITPAATPTSTPSPTPEAPLITPEATSPDVSETLPAAPTSTPIPSETEASVTPIKTAPPESNEEAPPPDGIHWLPVALFIVALAVLIAVPYSRLLWRKRKYFMIPSTEELETMGSPEDRLRFLWSRCLLHLRLADVRITPPETPLDFAARLENIRVSARGRAPGVYRLDIRQIASVYEKWIYGQIPPSADDIKAIRENCIFLADQIQKIHFSAVHYTINRMLKRLKEG